MDKVFTSMEYEAWLRRQAALMRPYWYGTYYLPCTQELLNKKKAQYPAHYPESRMEKYQRDIAAGQICGDCVNGAIKGAVWSELGRRKPVYRSHGCPDTNADGMFARCKAWGMEWGSIGSLPEEAGIAVRMSGHVGIYVGRGEVVEWRGFAYGCVLTRLSQRKWLHWYRLPWVEYVSTPCETPSDTLLPGARVLRRGCIGEDVRTVQQSLISLGYALEKYGADGEYGSETEEAVRLFQKKADLHQDGIYGGQTHEALMHMLSGREIESDMSAPAPIEKYVRVSGGCVNLRCGAGTEFDIVTVVRKGMRLEWLATASNGWHAVRADGVCGWLSPKYSEVIGV